MSENQPPSDAERSHTPDVTATTPQQPSEVHADASTPEVRAETPAVEATAAEPTAAQEHRGGAEGEDDGDGGDEGEGEGASAAGDVVAADGDAQGPKKRKRRRRKKKPAGAEGEGAQADGGGQPKPQKKEPAHVPFGRLFEGAGGARKHAFAVGEIVAGRVTRVEDNAIVVDLFGKALAFVDVREPRTIPDPPAPKQPTATASAASPSADGANAETTATGETTATASSDGATASADAATHIEAQPHAEGEHTEGHEHSAVGDLAAAEAAAADAVAADLNAEEHEAAPAPEEPALPPPNVGEIFRGRVGAIAESGHIAIVNRIVDVPAARAKIAEAREARRRVHGLVYGFNRGGFDVLVEGIRAFCPASGMSLGPVEDPEQFVGRMLEFSVAPVKAGTHGTVITRRSILEREARKRAKEIVRSLHVGQRIKGHVTQVREFGIFVDIGGFEGLVHISELSWDRAVKPEDVAKVGDELEVQVVRVPEGNARRRDGERGRERGGEGRDARAKDRHDRVGLSLKALQADPWEAQTAELQEGSVRKGKVSRTAEFGAFIELLPGIEGLLHISELGKGVAHARDAVKEGEEIDVILERIDTKQRRISLSRLSAADAKAIAEGASLGTQGGKAIRPGANVTVKVDRVEHHGVMVQIVGVIGKRGRGYIPNSEMGTDRGTDHRKLFPQGKELEVKVIGVDRDGGLKCSRKGFLFDEEKRAVSDYRKEASKRGLGTFGDLLRAKLGDAKQ